VSERVNLNAYGDPVVVQGGRHSEHADQMDEVNHRIAQVSSLPVITLLNVLVGVAHRLQIAVAPVSHERDFAFGSDRDERIQDDCLRVLLAAQQPLTDAINELLALEYVLTERIALSAEQALVPDLHAHACFARRS
jgi:hypothetical protein